MSNPKLFKYELIWDKKTGLGFLDSKFRPLKSHENIIVFGLGGCSNGSKIPMKYNPQGLIETTKQNKNTKSNILNSEPKKRENLGTTHTNYPKSILTFSRVRSGNHPTQKPVELFEYLIKTYTNEGDLVLDNAAGSGTTAIACLKTKRQFIVMEKEQEYYDIILKRVADFNKKFETQTLFENEM
jgi:site-specific DNA-methyltransferase (adenine-specific)